MSNIALMMNLLLGGLLVLALGLGWRLERRLKALRDSHKSFTLAVEDLDRAAARAEQGLADLRAATDEAAETLAARIERAGVLAASLERLSHDADQVEDRLTPTRATSPSLSGPPAPIQAARDAATRFAERYLAASREAPRPADVRTDLILDDEAEAPSTVTRFAPLRAETPARPAHERARSRSMVDDDLFEEPAPRRVGLGANR